MVGTLGQMGDDTGIDMRIEGSIRDDLLEERESIPPEQEKVNKVPPGFSSLKASRLISLYALAALLTWAAVGANLGGSRTIVSKERPESRRPRKAVKYIFDQPLAISKW